MATFDQSEESRPPDTPNNHRKHNKKTKNINRIERDQNKNCLYQKPERNTLKNTLPKLLCLKKSPSTSRCDNNNLDNFNTLCVSSLVAQSSNYHLSASCSNSTNTSLKCDYANNNESSEESNVIETENFRKSRSRNSFHQNVEEALSSLLWQPYEYQNNDEGELGEYLSNGSPTGDQWEASRASHGAPPGRSPTNPFSRANAVDACVPASPNTGYYEDTMEESAATTYRAVPANVCSINDVPTIHCSGNNVSNVQVLPLSGVQTVATLVVPVNEPETNTSSSQTRTFASVEAQTDEVPQHHRRRERRRRERTSNNNCVQVQAIEPPQAQQRLPDILDSHLPPPYASALGPPPPVVVPLQTVVPPGGIIFPGQAAQVPLVAAPQVTAAHAQVAGGFRWSFPHTGFRRGRLGSESSGPSPKTCCGFRAWRPGSLRWFIALIALVAVCCVLVGTALGAARPQGRDHLTVSLLMIGVGVVLVTVSGVAWRLTAHDASLCRGGGAWGAWGSGSAGGGAASDDGAGPAGGGRFAPRPPPAYGRPHHPYAAMMYPEFQYRPPPPSYQASMQEYRLRLLLLDRGAPRTVAASPPPTYRSHAGSLFRAPLCARREAQSEYSCPPSYRSQASSRRAASNTSTTASDAAVVVGILETTADVDQVDSNPDPKLEPADDLAEEELEGSKDGNLVTIVQTADRSPVIVTVSGGSGNCVREVVTGSEMEILAHL